MTMSGIKENKKTFFYARVLSDTNLYKVSIDKDREFLYGAEVIIKTEFGTNLATITSWKTDKSSSINRNKPFESGQLIRYATVLDKAQQNSLITESNEIKKKINELKDKNKLDMHITHILLSHCGKTIGIFYVAEERVDFRQLLIDLRTSFKKKVIMKQVSDKQREKSFTFDPRVPLHKLQY
jgi:cell fate regulator YaaT (PSP1 superfamily)